MRQLLRKATKHTTHVKRLASQRSRIVLFVGGFALVGIIALALSRAAALTASVQPENGSRTGVAALGSDTTASGGQYVLFGQSVATIRIEAEAAQHNVQVETAGKAYASGGSVLGFFGSQGKYVTFSVCTTQAGSYSASLRYAAADGTTAQLDPLPRTLLVNDQSIGNVNFPRTSSIANNWDSLTTQSLGNLTLINGTNSVTLRVDTGGEAYWDVDYLELTGANLCEGGPTPPPPPPPPPPPGPPPPPPPTGDYALPPYNIPSNAVHVSDGGALFSAINNAAAGTTIVVHSGNYGSMELNGKNPGGWVRVIGDPAGGRIPIGHVKFVNSSYIELRHLRITGTGQVANKAVEVHGGHHFRIYDNEITNGGEAGMSFPGNQGPGGTDHIDIRYNDVHTNARNSNQGWWQGSGLSILFSQDRGVEDVVSGYKILVAGNRMWNNYIDPVISGGILDPWGVTDGNCIIIDVNKNFNYQGRTLITHNICSDNGGVGVAITNSAHVDIFRNSLYRNVKTRIESVMNNGEIMCAGSNGSNDVKVMGNLVVPRDDNGNLFQTHGVCSNFQVSGNVWVRSGYPSQGAGDIVLPNNTQVFAAPNLNASAGNWTPIGQGVGYGAKWPQ